MDEMLKTDWHISLTTAVDTMSKLLDEMRHGSLHGCDPTSAAHIAASIHEAITATNGAIGILERERAQ